MAFKSPELLKAGFSADGRFAYCDVSLDNDKPVTDDDHVGIRVHFSLPVAGGDTLDQIRQRACQKAKEYVQSAARAAG